MARQPARRPRAHPRDLRGVVLRLPPRRVHAAAARRGRRPRVRIFNRDGVKLGEGPSADPRESPNADIVNELPARAGRAHVPVRARRRVLQEGLRAPLSIHRATDRAPRPAAADRRRHAGPAARRGSRPGVGTLMDDWRGLRRKLDVAAGVGVGDGRRGALRAPRAHRDGTARPNLISRRRPIMSMRKLGRTGLRCRPLPGRQHL